jgi:hypothetical protein
MKVAGIRRTFEIWAAFRDELLNRKVFIDPQRKWLDFSEIISCQ